ncbi:hypothetical protein [Chryseobacterium sp.]|uniref:hypothetical protein n=1 Tax=Chryseobacterium sp. TaxID=1871047 RepID=UPI00289A5633|nr:hypothetical protein [Chryseobacterium sp.]
MKKSFIVGSLILAFLTSCNNEQLAAVSYEAGKSPDVVNFEKAIKSLGNNYDFKAEAFTMGGDYWVIVK